MKIRCFILSLLISSCVFAQIPTGYYDQANGLTGYQLKTKLSEIISNGHRDLGYNALYSVYKTTDVDNYYEKDGSVLDIYSENPNGVDPYNFRHGQNQCGNYRNEGDCYNREHIIPQSFFNERSPMRSDAHFVVPTDGKVNGIRSNYPFGEVNSGTITKNGSKLGNNITSGFSGVVFEPIDEFKGDIARMVLYFVTRYENQLPSFSGAMLDGTKNQGLVKWQLDIMLKWHNQDPVSQREIDRNNAVYASQGNRNPYIDHPQWVNNIWNYTSTPDTQPPTAPTNLTASNITASSVHLNWTASTDNVGVGYYEIYVNGTKKATSTTTSYTVVGLSPKTEYSFYTIAKDAAGNASTASNTIKATTLEASGQPLSCGKEDFENIPARQSNYGEVIWTNNNITWKATDARTDRSINGSKAIMIRKGTLSSSSVSGGISSLTITTQMQFSGKNSTFDLFVNNKYKGNISFSSSATTQTIKDIDEEGNVIIEIRKTNPNDNNRVAIDDISWTCYSVMGVKESKKQTKISVYPNPIKNGEIYIRNVKVGEKVKIFNANGQLIQTDKVGIGGRVKLKNTTSGIYLISVQEQTTKIIVN